MRKHREILRLKWTEGRRHRQIARALRVGVGTVSDVVRAAADAGLGTRSPSASARRITVERDGLTCSPLAASGGSSASALAISATLQDFAG